MPDFPGAPVTFSAGRDVSSPGSDASRRAGGRRGCRQARADSPRAIGRVGTLDVPLTVPLPFVRGVRKQGAQNLRSTRGPPGTSVLNKHDTQARSSALELHGGDFGPLPRRIGQSKVLTHHLTACHVTGRPKRFPRPRDVNHASMAAFPITGRSYAGISALSKTSVRWNATRASAACWRR
jgi:hypothetical protein